MPNRVVRGELLNSERYWSVGLEGRQFFVHLLLVADDFGLVNGTSFWLRRNCFGPDGCDPKRLESLLAELAEHGLAVPYTVNEVRYLWLPRFGNFPRALKSKYPVTASVFKHLADELQCIRHADDLHVQRVRTASAPVTETVTETDREETPHEVRPAARSRGGRLPEDWRPSDELLAWAAKERPDLTLARTVEAFRDFWHAKAGKDATKVDWGKTFRNWVRNERRAVPPRGGVIAHPSSATPDEAVMRRISEANGGQSVIRLPDGRMQCGVHYYRPDGRPEVAI